MTNTYEKQPHIIGNMIIGHEEPYILEYKNNKKHKLSMLKQKLCGLFLILAPFVLGAIVFDFTASFVMSPVGMAILMSKDIMF